MSKFIVYQINGKEMSTRYEDCDLSTIQSIHKHEDAIKEHLNRRRKAKLYRRFGIFPAFKKIKTIRILYWREIDEIKGVGSE